MAQSELQEFIDLPNETLRVEYKDWLDLAADKVARANAARHIAALSNYGGGFIVFGFDDAMQESGSNPFADVTRDKIASITRHYLEPSPHCDVSAVTSKSGIRHTVIIVPAHGPVPVCSKSDGPHHQGKPQGIARATYYVRKTGPESAPIQTSAEWLPIIRRCVMHDKGALLAALGTALEPARLSTSREAQLQRWHDAGRKEFEDELGRTSPSPILITDNVQFTYAIDRQDGQNLDPALLPDLARQLNSEIRDRANTGWSMFFPFSNPPVTTFFATDPRTGDQDLEFLECSVLRKAPPIEASGDVWRIAPNGLATLIRPYRYDFLPQASREWRQQGWFSPNVLARELGELLRHAEAFSGRFSQPTQLTVWCELRGLRGRMLGDVNASWSPGSIASSEGRIVKGSWAITDVSGRWPSLVAELLAPVMRIFRSDLTLSEAWVQQQSLTWRPIGSQYP